MLSNMTVRSRLAVGFTLVLVFMVAIIGVGLYQTQLGTARLDRIVHTDNVHLRLANAMIDEARETAINVRDILLGAATVDTGVQVRQNRALLADTRARYGESMAKLKALLHKDDVAGTAVLGKLETVAASARQYQDQVVALAVQGRHVEAVAHESAIAYPAVKRWIAGTNDLIIAGEARIALRDAEAQAAARLALITMLCLAAAAILSSIVIVIVLSLSITKPLELAVTATTAAASGDLTVDLSSAGTRGDELGLLARSFSTMVVALKNSRDAMTRDLVERERETAEARGASLYTRNLFESGIDPLVTINSDGMVTDVNAAIERATGVSRERLIGSAFSDYFTEPEKARVGYEQAFSQEILKDYPLTIRHASGRTTDVLYNASVYRNEAREVEGVFAVARDVTESKRLEMQLRRQDWLKSGIVRLNEVMSGDPDLTTLALKVISEISSYLEAQVGVIYVAQTGAGDCLSLLGSYAYTKRKTLSNVFKFGEGLVGQAALEKKQIVIQNVPDDYIKVTSGLGERSPQFISVTPFIYENHVKGVVEVGTLGVMTDQQLEYLNQSMPVLALAVERAEGRAKLVTTLSESQALTEELKVQQEELQTSNEELEAQTQALRMSEEELKAQREELRVTNEELEEKNDLLGRQKRDVEAARKDIEEQARDLALASRYKSEFLANMSHELRTPLNSLLLLAQSLSENKTGNLTEEQVESARIIRGGGSDLLNLINEILDLSKIEAGRMDLQLATVRMDDLANGVRDAFKHMAEEKGLELEIAVRADAPTEMTTDRSRIEQVIKNLISNAIKFTDSGSVTVTFARPSPRTDLSKSGLSAGDGLAIAVQDTGIGIAPEDQEIVFEAFQQVDGGTARKYGGTGLGLSISRELARLLGGEIQIESAPGRGSTFTLYLPVVVSCGRKGVPGDTAIFAVGRADKGAMSEAARQNAAGAQIDDDRDDLEKGDRVILVIEDDPSFARILCKKCHAKGFKCLTAATGEAGLELAAKHLPSAVLLDIKLPGMDGWAVLGALKEDTSTRHIPVHTISAQGTSTESRRRGGVGHATKPVSQENLENAFRKLELSSAGKLRRVLLVEGDPSIRRETVKLIGDADVEVDEAETGLQALEALRSGGYDCVVLGLGLSDMDGADLLAVLEREGVALPPLILHTVRDLTRDEEAALRKHAASVVIKDVRSPERLLDEVSLFLHRVVSQMPEQKRQMILDLHDTDILLKDKKVLVVDDDMRATFAISHFLSEHGVKPLKAENGERALRLLEEQPDVSLVLMDIMMPVMDGCETTKRIRAQERFRSLPIIALTAKAMPEDRGKCLAAGASDYLSKPVDQERLVSMMRVWLSR